MQSQVGIRLKVETIFTLTLDLVQPLLMEIEAEFGLKLRNVPALTGSSYLCYSCETTQLYEVVLKAGAGQDQVSVVINSPITGTNSFVAAGDVVRIVLREIKEQSQRDLKVLQVFAHPTLV